MQQPIMRWNPDTQQVEEATGWAPAPGREQLEADLVSAQDLLKAADQQVKDTAAQLETAKKNVDAALELQEKASEQVAFQETRVANYDTEALRVGGQVPVDGAPSEDATAVAGDAPAPAEPTETVAAGRSPEATAVEPETPAEADAQVIPIRTPVKAPV
jgi:hypothetical protein